MKKFIKIFAFCLAILLLPTTAYAVNSEDPTPGDYNHAIYTLKKLNIIPSDYDTTGNATRMECLSMLMSMSAGMGIDEFSDYTASNYFEEKLSEKYTDTKQLTDFEKYIVEYSDCCGLLCGEAVDGKLYINPNKELTRREAITFVLRLICPENEGYNPGDDGLIFGASYRGFISSDDPAQLDTIVTDQELCLLINKALHTPSTVHGTFGDYSMYYIDFFLP